VAPRAGPAARSGPATAARGGPATAARGGPATAARDSYIAFAEAFNRDLKILTRDVTERYPDDATIKRAEKRIMLVVDTDPLYVIDLVGAYLLSYKDQIYALESGNQGAEEFFLESSYDSEIRAGVDKEKVDLVSYIMPKMKECVRTLAEDEKADYKRRVVSLLDNYVEYLVAKGKK
jgi:hypothetical protein